MGNQVTGWLFLQTFPAYPTFHNCDFTNSLTPGYRFLLNRLILLKVWSLSFQAVTKHKCPGWIHLSSQNHMLLVQRKTRALWLSMDSRVSELSSWDWYLTLWSVTFWSIPIFAMLGLYEDKWVIVFKSNYFKTWQHSVSQWFMHEVAVLYHSGSHVFFPNMVMLADRMLGFQFFLSHSIKHIRGDTLSRSPGC